MFALKSEGKIESKKPLEVNSNKLLIAYKLLKQVAKIEYLSPKLLQSNNLSLKEKILDQIISLLKQYIKLSTPNKTNSFSSDFDKFFQG